MINIGIDRDIGIVYEGDGHYHGRSVWPSPVITPAKFTDSRDGKLEAHCSSDRGGCRFREDSFDPVTRIRRGRFYFNDKGQPVSWPGLCHHSGLPVEGLESQSLETFYGNPIWHKHLNEGKHPLPLVLLGVGDRFTVWTILSVEAISTGEDLVTLKARSSFGILPEIQQNKIPKEFWIKFNEELDNFSGEVHRSSPVSVIDRAREVATLALLAYFNLQNEEAKDLADLIKLARKKKLTIVADSANIIARLHARAKPVEQVRRKLPQIRENDAEMAVQCIRAILCEIGFGEWK